MRSLPNDLHLMIYKQLHIDLTKRLNEEYHLSYRFDNIYQHTINIRGNHPFMFNYRYLSSKTDPVIYNIQHWYTDHNVPLRYYYSYIPENLFVGENNEIVTQ